MGFLSWVFIGVSVGAGIGLYQRLQSQLPTIHQPEFSDGQDGASRSDSGLDLNNPELMEAMESVVSHSEQKRVSPKPSSQSARSDREEVVRIQEELRGHWASLDQFEGQLSRLDHWEDRALVLQEMTDIFFQTEDARLRWSIMQNFESELENLSSKEMDFSNTSEANTHLVFLLRRYWEFASYTNAVDQQGSRLDKLKELRISNEMREFLEGYIHLGGDF